MQPMPGISKGACGVVVWNVRFTEAAFLVGEEMFARSGEELLAGQPEVVHLVFLYRCCANG
jgi:hypothetical protein